MIVLCSGEGPSDIGANDYDPASGVYNAPKWGAMGNLLLSMLRECRADYHDYDTHKIIHKKALQEYVHAAAARTSLLRGLDHPAGCAYFRKIAYVFALIALDEQNDSDDDVMAVLFRDSDSGSEAGNVLWRDKFKSIEDGFKLACFKGGVPMVPKPTSEAWCLAMFETSSKLCHKLENASNRDGLKKYLTAKLFEEHITVEEFYNKIAYGELPLAVLEGMESYAAFKDKFCDALRELGNAQCRQRAMQSGSHCLKQ